FRRYAFTDLLVRYIEYHKIAVTHVVNITDYDDKTIQGAQKAGEPLSKLTQTFVDLFKQDLLKLNIRPADAYPKVSDHFDEMIDVARQLQSKKHAYEKLHSLYFDIASQSEYGDFSRTNLDMIKLGATVDLDAYEKGNPKDFTLLKRVRLSELKAGVGIKTQWGNVRPSLHLQCAAIAMKFLGESFDIQTGSRELIFPHHENEVAIARALKGATLARYWLHCDPVRYDGSLGALTMESLTLETLVKKGWGLKTIRFWLISNHYRKTLILSDQALKQAQYTLDKINRCITTLSIIGNGSGFEDMDQFIYDMKSAFFQSMEDDLRISGAISSMLANVKTINRLINQNKINADGAQKLVSCFKEIDSVLKIFSFKEKKQYSSQIQDLIKERDGARQQNDFQAADKIRAQLINLGISVHDKKADL
ncbi:MAG: cysteine--tRNA ligase, partial [Proteobacteria bacterium]|nr:cysteine--tRNA ligase [Pseudomonadota bacterium]